MTMRYRITLKVTECCACTFQTNPNGRITLDSVYSRQGKKKHALHHPSDRFISVPLQVLGGLKGARREHAQSLQTPHVCGALGEYGGRAGPIQRYLRPDVMHTPLQRKVIRTCSMAVCTVNYLARNRKGNISFSSTPGFQANSGNRNALWMMLLGSRFSGPILVTKTPSPLPQLPASEGWLRPALSERAN